MRTDKSDVYKRQEEENAVKFLQSNRYDAVIVVCDAVCLERNLNLVLQAMEITGNIIVCINLLDLSLIHI